jgi:drug/metabolite transporter (DMT)-like permease
MSTTSSSPRTHRAALLPGAIIALAMLMFVVTETIARVGFEPGTSILQRVWLRYGFHLLFMIVVLSGPTRLAFVRTGRPFLHTIRSLLMFAMPACYVWATLRAPGAAAIGVFSLSPLLVIGFAYLGRERVPRAVAVLTAVGCAGAWILYRHAVASIGWAVIPALGMASSYSGYLVLTRVLDRTESLLTNMFYSAAAVFVLLTLTAPLYWRPLAAHEVVAGAALAASGWVVLYLIECGLRRDTAARLAPFLLTQTLLDGIYRIVDRGRHPDTAGVLGTAIIAAAIAGAIVLNSRESQQSRGVLPAPAAADGAA